MDIDIHNYKRRFEKTLEKIKNSEDISTGNKEVIYKFRDYCICQGISYGKIDAYLFYLTRFVKMLDKSLPEATRDDLARVIAELNQTDYSEETKVCFKVMVRKLYKMIRGIDEKHKYPPEVEWISTGISKNHEKLPEELLTEQEIKDIIKNCSTIRDKAFIAVLAESGCRIGEIGTMQIKHISFEEYGARLTVRGKTGMRKILVINSSPYLQEWVNAHPDNSNTDAYLWIKNDGEFLSYTRLSAILRAAAKKAKIKKRVYPHLLRHSRATALASIMTDSSMKQYLGWTQGSKMAGIYIHMNGKETDEAILRLNGIETKKEKPKSVMQPIKCIKCNTVNEATNRFCKICGLPLNKEEAERILKADVERTQADEIMNKLVKDPEVMNLIKKKLLN